MRERGSRTAGGSRRFRWTVALCGLAFLLGAYLDAWSRLHGGGPGGPWQDGLLDAAWLATTGFLAFVFARGLRAGLTWQTALPRGYPPALVGGVLFGLGALAGVYYEQAFGVAQGLDALLAPPRLLELVGGGLMVASPLARALRDRPERADWPVVIAASLTLSGLTLLTLFGNPLVDLWAGPHPPVQVASWVARDLGLVAILIQASLTIGVLLALVCSFSLPRGSLTILCGLDGVLLAIVRPHLELAPVMLLTGLVADLLLLRLHAQTGRTAGLRLFAATVPAVFVGLYWLALVLFEGGSSWSARRWAGSVLVAALIGFLVSYVAGIRPLRSLVDAEELAERWPRLHVQVSTAMVKEALDVLGDPDRLAASPLAGLPCVTSAGRGAGAELRGLLIEVMREAASARAPRDAEAGQLLVEYYVRQAGSHEVIAARLHLSRPTFYRRLQRGLTLVAERLEELSELASRQP